MYPFTKPQQSIYYMEKFSQSSVSVICGSMLMETSKPVSEMVTAVQEIYRLNDALRIQITRHHGHTLQYIAEYQKRDIPVLYFENKTQLDSYASAFAKTPFDLSASLCDIGVVILPKKAGLLVKFHHFIGDAWTIALIGTQFQKLLNKESITTFSYIDYIQTEKKYLESPKYQKDKSYFLAQTEQLDTPIYLSDKNTESLQAQRKSFELDSKTTESILTFASRNNTSAAHIFMTILSIYMSRIHMNAEALCLGTTILNRNGAKEKNTMGMFVNTVPFFIPLKNHMSFLENLENLQNNFLEVLRHQKYSYGDLLQQTGSSQKLFDVLFSYQNAQIPGQGIETTWYHCGTQLESLQIHIDDRDNNGIFRIHYDYQIQKFTEHDIQQLHAHLCTLLSDALNHPQKDLCKLELLPPSERQKVLYDFNQTKFDYPIPEQSTLYSLFEKTAGQNLSKICITVSGNCLTYGELLSLAELLHKKLNDYTQGTKTTIAIIAERSVEMYVAIYGILRGGNAYLPISPEDPKERMDYILRDSAAATTLIQDKFMNKVSSVSCLNITDFVNTALAEIKNGADTAPIPSPAKAEDTAYIIYTSGSTGAPKGARISHKSAVNRILWMQETYPLEERSVILQKTPYTFDVSVWELFWWSICGASLAASKPGEHFLPAKILEEVMKHQVTHLHFVPSVFDVFLTYLEHHPESCVKFHSVKHVFLSGEALSAELISRFYVLFSYEKIKLHNLYGPTECAVDVTYYDCTMQDVNPVPIGTPIHNTQIYILDTYLNPMPQGIVGELCIGGTNVGQGYLNKPELTAEKFIPNPFAMGMLYRTGDFAYFREDGQIIFMGRMDGQIKLHGQRIEITEIETAIRTIPGIDSAAVIVTPKDGHKILAAFYCGRNVSPEMIRIHCEKTLPRYMVPSSIVALEKMPLNSSGKLDIKALAREKISLYQAGSYEVPVNETEKEICNIFSQLLDTRDIDRNSNFFDLGGTSLSMIAFLSEDRFQTLSAPDFIANPTPAKLAKILKQKQESKTEFQFLKILKDLPNTKKALILIPYAGGGAGAFSIFVNTFTNLTKEYSIYYMDYLHSYEECASACKELKLLSDSKDIYVYSHCAGSAVAMQMINILEAEHKEIIRHYISGGFIPSPKAKPTLPWHIASSEPENKPNLWNSVPDSVLKALLLKGGAPLQGFNKGQSIELLKRFRQDTDFMTQYFAQSPSPVHCPVSVIISKHDIFTPQYKKAQLLWNSYAANLCEIRLLETKSHYFQANNCEEFSRILLSILK